MEDMAQPYLGIWEAFHTSITAGVSVEMALSDKRMTQAVMAEFVRYSHQSIQDMADKPDLKEHLERMRYWHGVFKQEFDKRYYNKSTPGQPQQQQQQPAIQASAADCMALLNVALINRPQRKLNFVPLPRTKPVMPQKNTDLASPESLSSFMQLGTDNSHKA